MIFLLSDCTTSFSLESKCNTDLDVSVEKDEIITSDSICYVCKSTLSEPHIRCAICTNRELCCTCFSKGREFNEHKNDHDYIIVRNEFPLIPNSDWTAKEELDFMDVLLDCGFGNWVDISRRMQGRSPEECKAHYLQNFIDHQSLPGLPKFKETEASLFYSSPTPYMFNLEDIEEPPRFSAGTVNSKLLSGYNAARSDFEINFDNHAELLICDLKYDEFNSEYPDDNLGRSLQTTLVSAYNIRLKERKRRQQILREHGLITLRRMNTWLYRYDNTITKSLVDRLLVFMQVVSGMDFDYIIEGLHRAGELKFYLQKLLDFRKNGIKYFQSVPLFQKLSNIRQESERDRKNFLGSVDCNWKTILQYCDSDPKATVVTGVSQRRAPPPLAIRGLPGYEKLSQVEAELCSKARIVPASFLDFKHILISENKRNGVLRLAQARVLLKIDVNKTRKIYDFLADQGYINRPLQ